MAPETDKAQITVSTEQARQGVTHHNVRYVLAFGLIGAIVALGLMALFF